MNNNENKTIERHKFFNLKSCIVILLLLFGVNAWGQITTINYSFEGSDKNRWTFVNGSATNKWCISKNANAQNGGTYSLYVTNGDGGLQTGSEQAYSYNISYFSIVWAYIDIYFPESSSDYTFSFDWKCAGESTFDYFSVFLGDASTPTALNSGNNSDVPAQPSNTISFTNNIYSAGGTKFNGYNGSSIANTSWYTFSQTLNRVTYSGTTKRLYFVWKDDNSAGTTPGAAIDNIKITYTAANPPMTMECGTTYSGSLREGYSGWQYYTGSGHGGWNEIGEEHIYSFTPDISGDYTFIASTIEGDPDFFVLSSLNNNTCIAGWDGNSEDPSVEITLTGGVTYYVVAEHSSPAGTQRYEIKVMCPVCSRSLSFGSSPKTVLHGSTASCVATPSVGGGTIVYESSNTSVATVNSSGVVTGVSLGVATITATVYSDGTYCDATTTHTIVVLPPAPSISQQSIPLCGNIVRLEAHYSGAVPSGYSYHWYRGSVASANEITEGRSGDNYRYLDINAVRDENIYCRLESDTRYLQATEFEYNGDKQTYTVPHGTTSLKLEAWGASGGRGRGNEKWLSVGGNGGYSVGNYVAEPGTDLYVVVGGKGSDAVLGSGTVTITAPGGYNGGGGGTCDDENSSSAGREAAGGGGGATHIAKAAPSSGSDYQLRYYNSNSADILLVAGGGGGGSYKEWGGTGGGASGGAGAGSGTTHSGGFGYGANAQGMGDNDGVAGAGGGWQGGNAYNTTSSASYAGGGSGYIGAAGLTSSSTTGGVVYENNGRARITATAPICGNISSPLSIACCDNPSGTFAINGSSSVTFGTDQTATLNVNNTTGYTISWVSDNTSIVTVAGNGNSAVITGGHALGTTTITASITPSDSDICPMELIYTITVNPTITFDVTTTCNGTPSMQPDPQTVASGTIVTVPWDGIECNGSTFLGWATNSNGTATYTNGSSITVNNNITLYAIFKPNHTLTVISNLPEGGTVTGSGTYYEGQTVNISATPASGYYLAVWSLVGAGSSLSSMIVANPTLTMGTTDATVMANFYLIEPSGGSDSDCGTKIIYCSTGGNDNNNGSSTAPVQTLNKALSLATGGTASNPAIIRMASGTYNVNAPVNLISNVIIDGQWTANTSTGVWTKGTTLTTINRTTTSPEGGTTQPRIVAIEGNSVGNFKLQDIKVTTANAPAYSAITSNNYGVSTYAVHLNGCSNYEFVRCQLLPGNASQGKAGQSGNAGAAGGGASGGSGGDGGSASSSSASNGSTGRTGSAGSYSGGSGGSGGNETSYTSAGNHTATGGPGGSGYVGTQGATGSNGTDGSISNTTNYGSYFTPGGQAGTGGRGGNGSGGGGGGGGGGARARVGTLGGRYAYSSGGKGGNGGSGGSGGYGGTGGYGGGSSFGVYHYGSTSIGTFTDCYIVSGTAGTGGNGGAGGSGGNGNNGSVGVQPDTDSESYGLSGTSYATGGKGGTGGTGGKGGTGGAGGKGANGVSYKVAVVTSSGLSSGVSSGYTTTPSNYVTSIDYGSSSKMGCTNSQIKVTKSSGAFNTSFYVNDKTPSSTTSTGNNAVMAFPLGMTNKALTNTTQYNPYIFIAYERNLGEIDGVNNICIRSAQTYTYTYTGDINNGDVLQWRLVSADGNTQYESYAVIVEAGSVNTYTINAESLGLVAGSYLIKLEIKSDCCGVSVPIWKEIEVLEAPTFSVYASDAVCHDGNGSIEVTASGGTSPYSFSSDNGSNWTSSENNPFNFSLEQGTYYILVKDDNECVALAYEEAVIGEPAEFTAGEIKTTGQTLCYNTGTLNEIGVTTVASGGEGEIFYQWYVDGNSISETNSSTHTPANTYKTSPGVYHFTRKARYGECPNWIQSDGSWTLTVEEASVGTVTASASSETICIGSTVTLSASAEGNSGTMSYVWEGGSTSVMPNATTTYHVTATATTAGAGCTAETIKEVTVTVTAPSVDGIASGDMVWSGNAGTTNWATAGNWLTYGGSAYSVAASAPSASTNIFLATYGECVTSNPALTAAAATKNLNIGSGRSLSLGSYTLSVAGNLTNNGTFNAGTGTAVFNGSTPQTISGTSLTFNNVTFNNAKDFTLDGLTPTVTGLATFTAGIVNGDMNFGASATTADASRTSHVDGKVTKEAGSSEFTFPTGNAGVLGSVTATVTSDTWVRFHNLVASGDALPADYPRFWNPNNNCADNEIRFDHVSNFEYWDINSPVGLSGATIVASADNAGKHFGSTDPAPTASDVFGAIWTGGCWSNLGGSEQRITDNNKTIMIEGVDIPAVTRAGTPYFTLGSKDKETLLPIELTSFTATCDGRSSLIEWTTATEKNNDYFSLERSGDAINFTEIARVAGAGNSIEPLDYSYTDYGIHGGDNYYRLVQVDYDGTRTVSEIVVANCIESEVDEPEVQAYPNPFSGELTLVLDNFNNRAATIEVYDMLGKLIYTEKASAPQNSYETILNLSNLVLTM